MKYFDFADKCFQDRKEIYEAVNSFSQKRNLNLFDKLLCDKNEVNFMSWLSEMKFGLRLDRVFQNIYYDKKINNQTPDWFVTSNGQTLIFEVVRLNLTENELLNKIDNLKKPKTEESNIIATVTHSKALDGKFFYGNINKISKKEVSYRKLVEDKNFKLIICVDSTEIELFTFYDDFYDFFIADGKQGYFNTNPQFGKNVGAVVMQVPFEGYKVILNEKCNHKLNEQNLDAIKQMCD